MKRYCLLLLFLSIVTAPLVSYSQQAQTDGKPPPKPKAKPKVEVKRDVVEPVPNTEPTLVFEHDRFDYGTVAYNVDLAHTFNFANEGSQTLWIKRIRKT